MEHSTRAVSEASAPTPGPSDPAESAGFKGGGESEASAPVREASARETPAANLSHSGGDNPNRSSKIRRRFVRPTGGIRARLVGLTIAIIAISILVVSVVAFNISGALIGQAEKISGESLRQQAEEYLIQINNSSARQNDLILDRAARDVKTVAAAVEALYASKIPLQNTPSQDLVQGSEGQYLNTAEEISSVFIPNTQPLNEAVRRDVDVSAGLDLILPAIQENNPNAAAIYLGTVRDMTRYFPNIELGKVVPADFSVSSRPWFVSAMQGNPVSLTSRPTEAIPIWSPVYQDATGLGLVTTVAVPAYEPDGSLIGVVGLDLTLDEVNTGIAAVRILRTGYSFLVDQDGRAIIFPEQGYKDLIGVAGAEQGASEFGIDLRQATAGTDFAPVLYRMSQGESGFASVRAVSPSAGAGNVPAQGEELFITYSPLPSTGWSLASLVPASQALESVSNLDQALGQTSREIALRRGLPTILGVTIVLVVLALMWTNRLVMPIRKLAGAAEQIGAGNWEVEIPTLSPPFREGLGVGREAPGIGKEGPGGVSAPAGDEIELLAHTLANMVDQLRQSFSELEQRVEQRTYQLEQRSLQIQTASEVARDISSASDLDSLLQRAVDQISARFGYYNVGIFLVDDSGEYAHLRAASGDLGVKLLGGKLANLHDIRLRVGLQGMVGYVTRYGQPRLADDVHSDPLYFPDPLLPDTRSEATLPLRAGILTTSIGVAGSTAQKSSAKEWGQRTVAGKNSASSILGALDVQSRQPAAFGQDDLIVLQILADQLAVAIQNIRLVERLQAALRESGVLSQNTLRLAWARNTAEGQETLGTYPGFVYDQIQVRPLGDGQSESSAGTRVNRLEAPLKLRGQMIGSLSIESDDPDHEWTRDEIAILEATANQAGLTIENARLLEATRRRAQREQLTSEITARMRASLDMDTILQTALRDIAEKMGLSQVEFHIGVPPPLNPANPTPAIPASGEGAGMGKVDPGIGAEGGN